MMDIEQGIDMAAAIQAFKSHPVFANALVAAAFFKHKLIVDPAELGVSVRIIFGVSFVSTYTGLGMDIGAAISARIAHANGEHLARQDDGGRRQRGEQ